MEDWAGRAVPLGSGLGRKQTISLTPLAPSRYRFGRLALPMVRASPLPASSRDLSGGSIAPITVYALRAELRCEYTPSGPMPILLLGHELTRMENARSEWWTWSSLVCRRVTTRWTVADRSQAQSDGTGSTSRFPFEQLELKLLKPEDKAMETQFYTPSSLSHS